MFDWVIDISPALSSISKRYRIKPTFLTLSHADLREYQGVIKVSFSENSPIILIE